MSNEAAKRPARLGRGLSALVGTNPAVAIETPTKSVQHANITAPERDVRGSDGLMRLPIGSIAPNPQQPRRSFDEAALRSLADSIVRDGLMQPVVVRAVGAGYELVAGERRLRASKLAGLGEISVIVREVDDRASAELALIENLQREDLNPVERARAFAALCERYSMTHAEVGERVGIDRVSVSNHLRLLDLDEVLLRLVESGRLGFGHARALLAVSDPSRRIALGVLASEESWSVRAVERAAAEHNSIQEISRVVDENTLNPAAANAAQVGDEQQSRGRARAVLDDMERRLGEHLGTRVTLRTDRRGQSGSVTIEFFSLDEFDGILDRLGYRQDVS